MSPSPYDPLSFAARDRQQRMLDEAAGYRLAASLRRQAAAPAVRAPRRTLDWSAVRFWHRRGRPRPVP